MDVEQISENAFYLLALLNPPSKVMFLSAYEPSLTSGQNFELSWKSSFAALLILILVVVTGQFLLTRIFRVELYSLQIAGGMVVFMIGWTAVREGRFVKNPENVRSSFTDLSLVPLAAPLIAGPGMIAAVIANGAEFGLPSTLLSMLLAILINFGFMVFSSSINKFLVFTHLQGPLIRLAGLVIVVIALQMALTGVKSCFGI